MMLKFGTLQRLLSLMEVNTQALEVNLVYLQELGNSMQNTLPKDFLYWHLLMMKPVIQ